MVLQVNYSRELSCLYPNRQSGDLPTCVVKIAYPLRTLRNYGNFLRTLRPPPDSSHLWMAIKCH